MWRARSATSMCLKLHPTRRGRFQLGLCPGEKGVKGRSSAFTRRSRRITSAGVHEPSGPGRRNSTAPGRRGRAAGFRRGRSARARNFARAPPCTAGCSPSPATRPSASPCAVSASSSLEGGDRGLAANPGGTREVVAAAACSILPRRCGGGASTRPKGRGSSWTATTPPPRGPSATTSSRSTSRSPGRISTPRSTTPGELSRPRPRS